MWFIVFILQPKIFMRVKDSRTSDQLSTTKLHSRICRSQKSASLHSCWSLRSLSHCSTSETYIHWSLFPVFPSIETHIDIDVFMSSTSISLLSFSRASASAMIDTHGKKSKLFIYFLVVCSLRNLIPLWRCIYFLQRYPYVKVSLGFRLPWDFGLYSAKKYQGCL